MEQEQEDKAAAEAERKATVDNSDQSAQPLPSFPAHFLWAHLLTS